MRYHEVASQKFKNMPKSVKEISMKKLNEDTSGKLTQEELNLIDLLGDAFDMFQDLPDRKDADNKDFMDAIHTLQHLVMIRLARRQHPDFF